MIRQQTEIRRLRDRAFATEIMLAACVVAFSLSPLAFAGEQAGISDPAPSFQALKPVHEGGLESVRGMGVDLAGTAQLAVVLWDESGTKCCMKPGPVSISGAVATQVVLSSGR